MQPAEPPTILVVDDEPSVLALVRHMLWKEGFRVLEASGGDEALRIAREQPTRIHLLLTDVLMPDMNGCELAEQMVKERPDLAVLFMSGFTDRAILESTGRSLKGAPLLRKPFTKFTLVSKITELFADNAAGAV